MNIFEKYINKITSLIIKNQKFLELNDFLILPTSPVEANLAEERFVEEIDGVTMNDYLDWLVLGYVISLTGCPAISIPCGFSSQGLPIGIQIISLPHNERNLLRLASWLESLIGCTIKTPITPVAIK